MLQAEAAYQRLVSDWQATRPRRISDGASSGSVLNDLAERGESVSVSLAPECRETAHNEDQLVHRRHQSAGRPSQGAGAERLPGGERAL